NTSRTRAVDALPGRCMSSSSRAAASSSTTRFFKASDSFDSSGCPKASAERNRPGLDDPPMSFGAVRGRHGNLEEEKRMTTLTPYLFFGGQCAEALDFYAKALSG